MNIIFFGTSNYCLSLLDSLSRNFQLTAIITKQNSTVFENAEEKNIKVFTPKGKEELTSLKDQISMMQPDLAIVADYGMIIPKDIFTIPHYKTLNIHFSKLPKYRGPSPIQYTLLKGEPNAWISLIIMDDQIDTGDIVWQKEIPLTGGESTNCPINQLSNSLITETTEDLYIRLFNIAASELPEVITKFVQNELKPQKQDNSQASYTKNFSRIDGFIPFQILARALNWKEKKETIKEIKDWKIMNIASPEMYIDTQNQLPVIIDRICRAFSPWPGLWTTVQITVNKQQITKRLKILKANLIPPTFTHQLPTTNYHPTTTNHQLPTSTLVLDLVQLEGKKPVSWKQFCEGYPDAISEVQPRI